MPEFRYTVRDSSGRQEVGSREAASRDELVGLLRGQGLLVLEVAELGRRAGPASFSLNPLDYRPLRPQDIEHDFHQVAIMLRSGVSLLSALELTAEYSRIGVRSVWQRVIRRVQRGSSFAEALAEHKAFNTMTLQLVRVGEQSGNLDQVMDLACEELGNRRRLKAQLRSAVAYPSVVVLMAIGVTVFLLTVVIPEIKKLLAIMGREMPPITQALIDVSDWLVVNVPFILIGTAAAVAVFVMLYRWAPSRWWIDRYALRVPILGRLLRLAGTVAFARGMHIMLRSGVRITEALETAEKLHQNRFLASRVAAAREQVNQGSTLSEPLGAEFGYMPLLPRMMAVGESSGTLDQMLDDMARYHEELLQKGIQRLAGMLGPAITVVVGGLIGFVYAAFLVAMFSAAGGRPG